ncbi:2-isopropylmalate synthase [Bordetella genomosp. 5]|uniref:2-isopropylmalate synthase n=1 Tax=Bordetella genomosp. 5 TaxID=1395608 RepID=UPI000B9DE0A3|nr:2-isopropylmalate synthase [Bordetella genomosp. 5]OZI39653.1 2-isopropylmalate synthase [Bordetella genomosp. 5]
MVVQPHTKYRPLAPVALSDRQWPSQTLSDAPCWLSADLSDGNQALFEPMDRPRKLRLFRELVRIGFREIELGTPAVSQTDHELVRHLIDRDLIPRGVTPALLTPLQPAAIRQTVASARGARRVIVHLFNPVAPAWRELVLEQSVEQIVTAVREGVELLRELTDAQPDTEWTLQYSPETFCQAELEVSLAVCAAAIEAWDAGPGRPMIVNLPATVEVAMPNVFADQVEWMHRHLPRRADLVLSVHPHNDRGTAVACAEQALLAGAQRVEGCLFGNGERSGNLDLVTLALNLYTQGIWPGLDFSDLNAVARVAEENTGLRVPARHPYAGDLVFTAFSGTHQEAIAKGLAAQDPEGPWRVPYLAIDPRDVGRSYGGMARVNAASGKGGIAHVLERDHGIAMPRRMRIEFGAVVQRLGSASEADLDADEVWRLFQQTYEAPLLAGRLRHLSHELYDVPGGQRIRWRLSDAGVIGERSGRGSGPLAAAADALGMRVDYVQHSLGQGDQARPRAVVEAALPGRSGPVFGVGMHEDLATAEILALLCAHNRVLT